jgi:hypothetical protein
MVCKTYEIMQGDITGSFAALQGVAAPLQQPALPVQYVEAANFALSA